MSDEPKSWNAIITERYWHDTQRCSMDAKAVGAYLLTGTQANEIGLYKVNFGGMAESLGIKTDRLRKAFNEIIKCFGWLFDEDVSVILIRGHFSYTMIYSPKHLKGAIKRSLCNVPETPLMIQWLEEARARLKPILLDELNACAAAKVEKIASKIKQLKAPGGAPVPPPMTAPPPPPPPPHVEPSRFAEFYAAYPKKKAKPRALAAWKKLKPNDQLARQIIDDVARRSLSEDWTKDGGQYVPKPSNYLRDREWEDPMAPTVAGAVAATPGEIDADRERKQAIIKKHVRT